MREALAFLTILPVGARSRAPGKAGLLAFPFVGGVIGAAWAGIALSADRLWGPLPAAALVLVADLLLTGGLHLDALADVADGIASRRPGDEAIAIMRDPRVGAIGAAVLGTALAVRFSFLALLVSHERWTGLVVAPIAGRVGMVWVMLRSRCVSETSLASSVCSAATLPVGIATGVAALGIGYLVAGARGLAAVIAGAAVGETSALFFRRWLGGLVGDAIGATGLVAELIALALLSADVG